MNRRVVFQKKTVEQCKTIHHEWDFSQYGFFSTCTWIAFISPYIMLHYMYERFTHKHMHIYNNVYTAFTIGQAVTLASVMVFHVVFWFEAFRWYLPTQQQAGGWYILTIMVITGIIMWSDNIGSATQYCAYKRHVSRYNSLNLP